MIPHQRIRRAILAILTVIIAIPTFSIAQTTDVATLRQAIERNGELLMEATVLVRETNSVKARATLDAARKLHEASIRLLEADSVLRSARTAKEAREAILRAIAIARQEARMEGNAIKALERATNRLDQARSALAEYGERDDVSARKLVEEAHVQLQRSRDNVQEHMFEVALHLAKASAELSARALRMLKRDALTPERVRGEINRTENVLARLEEHDLTERPAIARAFNEASQLQQRARRIARSGNLRVALEQTRRARDIALRLLKSAGAAQDTDGDSVARALRFTEEVLDQSIEYARTNNLETVREKLTRASRTQQQARDRYHGGQFQAAMRLTMRARDIAKNAVRETVKKDVDAGTVRSALGKTDEMLRRLHAALSEKNNGQAQALYKRASQRQVGARDAFESRQPRKALALTKVARNLAAKALRALGGDDG